MEQRIATAEAIAAKLIERGETVAVSESSAGGLVSAALLAVPGASAFYRGGGIIYTPAAFRGLVGLTKDDLANAAGAPIRSATEPYAALLAATIRERLRADWGLSETGATGPDGNPYGDPAGHACFGVAGPSGVSATATFRTGRNDRVANMERFAAAALEHLLHQLD